MRPGIPVFVVDSVEKASKFYTEKLGFDVAELNVDPESKHVLSYVMLKKGKCFISFRTPAVEELAEFSLIKRCTMRGAGVYVPLKKNIEKYFERCKKKKLPVGEDLTMQPWGDKTFVVKDPFGIRLMFGQPAEGYEPSSTRSFLGLTVQDKSDESLEEMVKWLRGYGILRRAAKKYAKLWLKNTFGK